MRVYIAGPYAARDKLAEVRDMLHRDGHVVTSRWLNASREIHAGTVGTASDHDDETVKDHVLGDLDDVGAADMLVLFTGNAVRRWLPGVDELWLHTGGRHIETGYALAQGIPFIVVGDPESIFHRALAKFIARDVDQLQSALEYFDAQPSEIQAVNAYHNRR